MAIYIEKNPQEAPLLLKYVSVIRKIAATNGDAAWRQRILKMYHINWWQCTCLYYSYLSDLYSTVKHVYSDHAYNEMTLITKHLGIPGKHSIFLFINFTPTAKLHITYHDYNEVILKP